MTIWKVTKLISSEGKPHQITNAEPLSEGVHEIRHADSVVPLIIRRGDVVHVHIDHMSSGAHMEFANEPFSFSLREVVLEPVEGEKIFDIWAPVQGEHKYNEVVSVERHTRNPMRGKER